MTLLTPDNPPPCDGLDIDALAKAFGNVNTSYKFFWARSLMAVLVADGFQSRPVSFVRLAAGMLEAARRAVCIFRLRLPKDDRLAEWFLRLEGTPHWDSKTLARLKGNVIAPRARHIPGDIVGQLTKFVPYLFLSPFFDKAIPLGVVGEPRFRRIREEAAARFDGDMPPPYRFADDAIIVHPKWAQYFRRNYEIINSWILWKLARYVQRINPNVPGIAAKLDDAAAPKTTKQRQFWQQVMESRPSVYCIYSGEKIDADNFALDHYLPWSFVAHDNMWNLVLVSEAGNADKSDNLPNGEEYFDRFAEMQNIAVQALHTFPNKSRWESIFEPYSTDLNFDPFGANIDGGELHSKLAEVINPLIAIAKTRGFEPDWEFDKTR